MQGRAGLFGARGYQAHRTFFENDTTKCQMASLILCAISIDVFGVEIERFLHGDRRLRMTNVFSLYLAKFFPIHRISTFSILILLFYFKGMFFINQKRSSFIGESYFFVWFGRFLCDLGQQPKPYTGAIRRISIRSHISLFIQRIFLTKLILFLNFFVSLCIPSYFNLFFILVSLFLHLAKKCIEIS